jgi:short-subunit dehydrogenase
MREGSGRLPGWVAIVTGASAGIGAATAIRLAAQGAHVALVARRANRLEALEGTIRSRGGSAIALPADVTSAADRERVVRGTLSAWGRVDALVNNAGYGQRGPVELVPLDAVRRNFETNVFAAIGLAQLVIPSMRAQGAGRIVNVSSVAGRIVWPFSSVYGATKHALEAISDGMRIELEPFGIRVVVIEPGFVLTEFNEAAEAVSRSVVQDPGPYGPRVARSGQRLKAAKRLAARPEDIADLVVTALASPRPRTRYAAPLHARIALVARRALPQRLLDRLLTAGRR